MITCEPRGGRGLVYAGLLSLLFLSVPALARTGDYYGPVYSSSGEIQTAQRVLRSKNYLRPGYYTAGRMDQPTIDALRAFQRDHFVPDSGLLDQETMAQLMSHRSSMQVGRTASTGGSQQGLRTETGPSGVAQDRGEAQRTARTMPQTASPLPLMTGLGALLVGGGLLLARRKRT